MNNTNDTQTSITAAEALEWIGEHSEDRELLRALFGRGDAVYILCTVHPQHIINQIERYLSTQE